MINADDIFMELLNRFPEGRERVDALISLAEKLMVWGLPALTPQERLDVVYRLLKACRND